MGRKSDYRYVPLVVQSPGRVAPQTHRAVGSPSGRRGALLASGPQSLGGPPRKLCVRAPDGVEDVRIGPADLCPTQPDVEAPSKLIEDVETGRGVLHLDRVEVQLSRQPADPVHHTA